MRQNASLGERCEDGDTVTGDSSPKRRPDCALYPTSPHATGELGARAFAGSIHRVRVISSSTASLRQGQSRVHSTACDRPPRCTEQMKQSVSERRGGRAETKVSSPAFPLGQITDPDLILSYTSCTSGNARKRPSDTRVRHHRHASSGCTCSILSTPLSLLGMQRRRPAAPMYTVLEQEIFIHSS